MENVLNKVKKVLTLRACTEKLWSELVLELLDSEELFSLLASILAILFAAFTVLLEEGKITVDEIKKEIAQGDEVISSALGLHVECVLACENHVAREDLLLLHWDVVTVGKVVFLCETKINDSDLVEGLLVIG